MANQSKAIFDSRATYEQLAELGQLDCMAEVVGALQRVHAAEHAHATALVSVDRARQDVATAPDSLTRRRAHRALDLARDAQLDTEYAVRTAHRELSSVRRQTFDRVVPVLEAERDRRVPRILAALRELRAAANELRAVEMVASGFYLASASIAPATTALQGAELGAQLTASIDFFENWLARLAPSSAA